MLNLIKQNNDVFFNVKKSIINDIHFYQFLGGRGIGKTTSCLIDCLEEVNKDNQFIYITRYASQCKKLAKGNFLQEVTNEQLDYKKDGNGGYFINQIELNEKGKIKTKNRIGFIMALSNQSKYKSNNIYEKVTRILYDEFLIKVTIANRYIDNECSEFIQLISTIVRLRTNFIVYMCANNVDLFNPYFEFFNIPYFQSRIYVDKEKGLKIELCSNSKELIAMEEKTPIFKLLKDTALGKTLYSSDLELDRTFNTFIPKMKAFIMRCQINMYTLIIYKYYKNEEMYLYVEETHKKYDDNFTWHLYEGGNINYLELGEFKKRYKNWIYKFFFTNHISFKNNNIGLKFQYLIDNI